jgi:hypothetical protein
MLAKAIQLTIGAFYILIFLMMIGIVLFSALLWYAEQTGDAGQSWDKDLESWIYPDGRERF